MADDIVEVLRKGGHETDVHVCETCDGFCYRFEVCDCCWAALGSVRQAADEIERLRAELDQSRINLQQARTGKALLDLEREREERHNVEQSLIRTTVRLILQNRDLRAHNEHLEQRLANRQPDLSVDVAVGTAIDTLRQINRHLDSIEQLAMPRKDTDDETQP